MLNTFQNPAKTLQTVKYYGGPPHHMPLPTPPSVNRLIRAFPSGDPHQYQNSSDDQTITSGKMTVSPLYKKHVSPPCFITSAPPKTVVMQKAVQ